eukprot:TRINITY_DN4043_c0_g1_i5.p1 TRINITY_DN4043_c0_g1~~TRINITY_DN4043_c0_g1_i5.p1  ORF type:complete len:1134 (+),score=234.56 TRINITY_DN4043_c0_g1_i5:64-3402(+)
MCIRDRYYSMTTTGGSCIYICPVGLYPDTPSRRCLACPDKCRVCGPGGRCLECNQKYIMILSANNTPSCVDGCADGNFYNRSRMGCDVCPSNCTNCTSPTDCLGCKTGYSLTTVKNFGKLCLPCTGTCESCPPGYVYFQSICMTSCPPGTNITEDKKGCTVNASLPQILNIQTTFEEVPTSVDFRLKAEVGQGSPEATFMFWSFIKKNEFEIDLLAGVNANNSVLIIPKGKMSGSTAYTLNFTVGNALANATKSFTITTAKQIQIGQFIVTPDSGVALDTTFTAAFSSIDPAENVTYSLTVSDINTGIPLAIIGYGNVTGKGASIEYIFPDADTSKSYLFTLSVSNPSSTAVATKRVLVAANVKVSSEVMIGELSANLPRIAAMGGLELYRALALGSQSLKQSVASTVNQELFLRMNIFVQNKPGLAGFCNDASLCSSQGNCTVGSGSFSCLCANGFGGYDCSLTSAFFTQTQTFLKAAMRRYMELKSTLNFLTLFTKFEKVLDADDLQMIALIYRLFAEESLAEIGDKMSIEQLLEITSNVLSLMYRRAVSSESFTYVKTIAGQLKERAIKRLHDLLNPGDAFTFKTNVYSLSLQTTSGNSSDLIKSNVTVAANTSYESDAYITISSGAQKTYIPRLLFMNETKVSIVQERTLISFETKSPVMSEFSTVRLRSSSGSDLNISNSTLGIFISMPKVLPTKVQAIRLPDGTFSNSSLYKCIFINPVTSLPDDGGCSLHLENTTHITCRCNHLTQFASSLASNDTSNPEVNELFKRDNIVTNVNQNLNYLAEDLANNIRSAPADEKKAFVDDVKQNPVSPYRTALANSLNTAELRDEPTYVEPVFRSWKYWYAGLGLLGFDAFVIIFALLSAKILQKIDTTKAIAEKNVALTALPCLSLGVGAPNRVTLGGGMVNRALMLALSINVFALTSLLVYMWMTNIWLTTLLTLAIGNFCLMLITFVVNVTRYHLVKRNRAYHSLPQSLREISVIMRDSGGYALAELGCIGATIIPFIICYDISDGNSLKQWLLSLLVSLLLDKLGLEILSLYLFRIGHNSTLIQLYHILRGYYLSDIEANPKHTVKEEEKEAPAKDYYVSQEPPQEGNQNEIEEDKQL